MIPLKLGIKTFVLVARREKVSKARCEHLISSASLGKSTIQAGVGKK